MEIIREMADSYRFKGVSRSSAALSYYLTLSIFPLLICLTALLSMLDISGMDILAYGEGLLPEEILTIFAEYTDYISGNFSSSMLVAGTLLMLTTSSAGFRALLAAVTAIRGEDGKHGTLWFILSFAYSILFLLSIYLSIVIIITGGWFIDWLQEFWHYSKLTQFWRWFRFVLMFAIFFLLITGLYKLSLTRGKRRSPVGIGAGAAALGIVLVSIVMSRAIDFSARYSLVYGSLASMVILMVWLYFCGNILIMGSVLNVLLRAKGYGRTNRIQ